jgi:hypothetical protein
VAKDLTPHQAIVKAIVHLNFNETDKALEVLLDALHNYNWQNMKEIPNGNRPTA